MQQHRANADVQDAIDDLQTTGGEVWIAEGTYSPSRVTNVTNSGDITSFVIYEGVNVYGGFAGADGKNRCADCGR